MPDNLRRLIDEARARTDIVDLISEDYPLEESGGHYWRGAGHNSLVVDSAKQCWFWNSRGTFGDAIDWLTKQRNMTFREALDQLLGFPLRPQGRRQQAKPRPAVPKPRNMALDALGYHQALMTSQSAMRQLQRERNLRLTTVLAAKLGWHPEMRGWTIPHWRYGNTNYCSGIKVRLARGKLRYASVKGSKFELYMPPPLPNLDPTMLFLVEGEWKALAIMGLGAYAAGCPANARFRKEWGERLLSKFGHATFFAVRDNDIAGLVFLSRVRAILPWAMPLAPPLHFKSCDDWAAACPQFTLTNLIEDGARYV